MKMRLILLSVAAFMTVLFQSCDLLGKAEEAKAALGLNTEEVDGTASSSELDAFFNGEAIVKGDYQLYYVTDKFVSKSIKLRDGSNANSKVETYFTREVSSLSKAAAAAAEDYNNDPNDLAGTWKAYRQNQDVGQNTEKEYLIDLEDNNNKFELIITVSADGKSIEWETKVTGNPELLSQADEAALLEQIQAEVAAEIKRRKDECDARTDFDEAQKALCKEKVDACAPGGDSVGTSFCVQDKYNPCDRPDVSDKEACEQKLVDCAPGGALDGTDACMEFFDPCEVPEWTAEQKAECRLKFDACGPGGSMEGAPECGAFEPCTGLTGDEKIACEEIQQKCSPDSVAANEAFCTEVLDPCNLPGMTNEQREACKAHFDIFDCGNPDKIDLPECNVTFDPCAELPAGEMEMCRETYDRCGPRNLAPTPEDIDFCNKELSPCSNPALTPIQKQECEAHWAKCGPGGTMEGAPECFEVRDPCMDPMLDSLQRQECKINQDLCGPDGDSLGTAYCEMLAHPCNILGLTQEQRDKCFADNEYCKDPANADDPKCQVEGIFDPCGDPNMSAAEQETCRQIGLRCGPDAVVIDEAYCREQLNPCMDPLMTDEERIMCEDHWFNCGPGGSMEGMPECVTGFDPCDKLPTPLEVQQCKQDRDKCSPENYQANKAFCDQAFDPCKGLVSPQLEECLQRQAQCGPQVMNPDPSCFEVNRDPCRPDALPKEKELCQITQGVCVCDETGCSAADPADQAFCDGGSGDPCGPDAGPTEQAICNLMMSTCIQNVPTTPEDQKFCYDYAGGNSNDGIPLYKVPAAEIRNILAELQLGAFLTTFTATEVTVAYVTEDAFMTYMSTGGTNDMPDMVKVAVPWAAFHNNDKGDLIVDIAVGGTGPMVPYIVLAADLPDPNDPNASPAEPGNVPGGPMIYIKGIVALDPAVIPFLMSGGGDPGTDPSMKCMAYADLSPAEQAECDQIGAETGCTFDPANADLPLCYQ